MANDEPINDSTFKEAEVRGGKVREYWGNNQIMAVPVYMVTYACCLYSAEGSEVYHPQLQSKT